MTIRKIFLKIYQKLYFDILISLLLFLINFNKILFLNYSDKNIVILAEGGYGHTVHDVDLASILFPNNCIFIILADFGRFNSYQNKLWKNIYVITLIRSIFISPIRHKLIYEISKKIIYYYLSKKTNKIFMYEDDHILYSGSKLLGKGLFSEAILKAQSISDFNFNNRMFEKYVI